MLLGPHALDLATDGTAPACWPSSASCSWCSRWGWSSRCRDDRDEMRGARSRRWPGADRRRRDARRLRGASASTSPVAIVIGGAIAMSSTAIVVRQLAEQAEVNRTHGRLAVGILLFQDLAFVPFLALKSAARHAWRSSGSDRFPACRARGRRRFAGRADSGCAGCCGRCSMKSPARAAGAFRPRRSAGGARLSVDHPGRSACRSPWAHFSPA